MRNTQKFALVCGCMIGIGAAMTAAGYAMGGRVWGITVGNGGLKVNTPNSSAESAYEYLEETRELEEFTDMDINVDFCDLIIEPSDHFGVSYCVDNRYRFSADVVDGCLTVTQLTGPVFGMASSGNLIFFGTGNIIDFRAKDQYVKVYIPENAKLGSVKLVNGNGDVTGSGFTAENLTVQNSFGEADLSGIDADSIEIAMGNGTLEAKELLAETLNITQEFGDIVLEDSKITGTAVLSNGNGSSDIKKTDTDDLKITSEFGDVNIELTGSVLQYTLNLNTEFGEVKINGEDMGESYKSLEEKEKSLNVDSGNGDIVIQSET